MRVAVTCLAGCLGLPIYSSLEYLVNGYKLQSCIPCGQGKLGRNSMCPQLCSNYNNTVVRLAIAWAGELSHPIVQYFTHFTFTNSTSNLRVAFRGMSGGAPCAPYAICGGTVNLRLSPTRMPATPLSQPLMTSPVPADQQINLSQLLSYPEWR